jgi:predicted Zn-dependent peptidase
MLIHVFSKVQSKISTIAVTFDAGARAEGSKFSPGLAHMLEHMIFKGTPTRSYLEIPKQIAFLGGNANAFTSMEKVTFYISVPYENTEQAMEILSDMVFNSILPEDEFLKEREVVKEEELSSKDDVQSYMWDNLCKEVWPSRFGLPIIGTPESIAGFTHKELVRFYKKFYKPKHALVSFSGNFSKREAKKMMTKYFGRANGKMKHLEDPFFPKEDSSRTVTVTRPELEHTYVMITYPGESITSPHSIPDDIMLSILGEGMDSRLFTEVREKRGLCYGISAGSSSYRDYGLVMISSSTREENLEQMLALIDQEVGRIRTESVTEEELQRAKNKYRIYLYSLVERSQSMAMDAGSRAFYGQETLEELEGKVNSVTVQDILEAAQRNFDPTRKIVLICKEEDKNEA